MELQTELIKQFVDATNDSKPIENTKTSYYGTTVITDRGIFVKLDGSDAITPVSMATDAKHGDRVIVSIEDHKAQIYGNITSPSSGRTATDLYSMEVTEDGTVVVKGELRAAKEYVDDLVAKDITTDSIDSTIGYIGKLTAENITSESIIASNARIENLESSKVDTSELEAELANIDSLLASKAEINDLTAATGRIDTLESTSVTTAYLTSNYITAADIQSTYASITNLETNYLNTDQINANYAQIDLANVEKESVGTLLANVGLITSAVITDGHVTGYLDSVSINANDITAGTLTVDRLIISGTDKSIVYALNNSGDLTSTEVDTINGDVLTPRTITADHIVAETITSNELASDSVTADKIIAGAVTAGKISVSSLESIVAKIGSFTINNALYTNNHSEYNSEVDGVYVGSDYISLGNGGKTWIKSDGSASIGSGAILYDSTTNDLSITANTIKIDTSSAATTDDVANNIGHVEDTLDMLDDQVNNSIADIAGGDKYVFDENGNKIQATDEEGNLLFDEDGIPIYLTETVDGTLSEINNAIGTLDERVSEIGNNISDRFTELQQTIDGWDFDWSNITNGEENVTDFIRFVNGKIILGKKDSSFIVEISNEKISFLQDETEVAYISNNELKISTASVVEDSNDIMKIGGFKYYLRNNGNLSFNIM